MHAAKRFGAARARFGQVFEGQRNSKCPAVSREDDVEAAGQRIARLRRADAVDRKPRSRGHTLWLKCECLQTGGAFKLRGATNRLLQLRDEERQRGVVAFSSGNHAQGVAIAAQRLGIPATIVMPADAPAVKVEATRAEGAEIVFYDRRTREPRGDRRRASPPSAARWWCRASTIRAIVAGQGTVGLEILEQLGTSRRRRIVVPTGGGGLASGIALGLPGRGDRLRRARRLGRHAPLARSRRDRAGRAPTRRRHLCDALQTPLVSPITFGILQARGAQAPGGQRSRGRARRCASPGASIGWWSSRAARSRWRRCSPARSSAGERDGGGAVGRECRPGASRADRRMRLRRRRCGRCRARHATGLERSTCGSAASSSAASVCSSAASALGSVSPSPSEASSRRVEHHRDARQDRFLDPLERLFEARLLLVRWPLRHYGRRPG